MKRLAWLVIGVVLALGGLAVYLSGAGYFWPCEALGDRKLCNEIASMEGRSFQAMAVRGDGALVVATRQSGTQPSEPIHLVTLDPVSGETGSEVALAGLDPKMSVSDMALSEDGDRIALAGLDFFEVIDAAGASIASIERGLPAYMSFGADGRLLVYQGTAPEPVPQRQSVLAFDLDRAGQPQTGISETGALFSAGLNQVVRQDGALVAQKLPGGEGVVGIRLVATTQPAAAGQLLAARLRPGCSYHFVDMAFSPDGELLAATADCPERWGEERSALVIWDVESGEIVRRIPTRHWWGDMAWLDDSTMVLARYDVDARRAGLFRVELRR